MHFDALTLACMADELRRTLIPGRVQQVLLVDEHSLGLEVYAGSVRHQLLLAADSAAPRIQRLAHKLRRGVEQETPFLLLLRKYVRDASLEQVIQPDPAERVLHLHFAHRTLGPTLLVAELLGRQSNLLLLRGDRILDCLRRVTPEDPAGRWLQPGRLYAPPAPQAKLAPLDDGSPDYYERLAALLEQPGKRWKALVDGVAGLSPTAARELVWQVTGAAETTAPVELLPMVEALQALWQRAQTGSWQPGVALEGDAVAAFAAYPLHYRGVFQATADLSAALAAFYGAPDRPAPDPYAGQRAQVQALLRKAEQRLLRRLAALAGDEPAPGEPERLRQAAEWLLALNSTITPEQRVLEVDLDGETLRIDLDPAFTPIAQAERWFRRAGKLKRAAQIIPQRRAVVEQDLAFVAQLKRDLAQAENANEIGSVRTALAAAGLVQAAPGRSQPRPAPTAAAQPLRFRSAQGYEIVVGRNAGQNEQITFKLAQAEDLWLHARGVPGAHVIVRSSGRTVDPATVQAAAQLAAYHSDAKGERAAAVIVTERKWVQRAPGGHPGQVIVRQERVVVVQGAWPEDVTPVKNPR